MTSHQRLGRQLAGSPESSPASEPFVTVVKGDPTPEELAAVTVVLLSLGTVGAAEPTGPNVRRWVRRQQLGLPPTPGPGAWKRSNR